MAVRIFYYRTVKSRYTGTVKVISFEHCFVRRGYKYGIKSKLCDTLLLKFRYTTKTRRLRNLENQLRIFL